MGEGRTRDITFLINGSPNVSHISGQCQDETSPPLLATSEREQGFDCGKSQRSKMISILEQETDHTLTLYCITIQYTIVTPGQYLLPPSMH